MSDEREKERKARIAEALSRCRIGAIPSFSLISTNQHNTETSLGCILNLSGASKSIARMDAVYCAQAGVNDKYASLRVSINLGGPEGASTSDLKISGECCKMS